MKVVEVLIPSAMASKESLLDFQLLLLLEPDHLSLAQQLIFSDQRRLWQRKGGCNLLGGLIKGQIHLANQILVFSDGLPQVGLPSLNLG